MKRKTAVKRSFKTQFQLLCACLGATLATTLCTIGTAYAEPASNPVMLVTENSWPPYSDVNGQGLSTDLVTAAYQAVGQSVDIGVMPYARVERHVRSGFADGGYNITRQSSTEEIFLFGREVLLTAPASFYFQAGSGARYKSYADIPDGTRIGLIIDYEYGDIYQKNARRLKEVRVSKQSQLIKMLKAGRIDTAIMFDRVAAYTLRALDLPSDDIDKSFQNHTSDIYVGFSLERPSSSVYAELLDDGLQLIRQSGEYQALVEKSLIEH